MNVQQFIANMQTKMSVWAPNLSGITFSHVGIGEGCRAPRVQAV